MRINLPVASTWTAFGLENGIQDLRDEPRTRLANAIFDTTGVRLRQIPFTPERVKQALSEL